MALRNFIVRSGLQANHCLQAGTVVFSRCSRFYAANRLVSYAISAHSSFFVYGEKPAFSHRCQVYERTYGMEKGRIPMWIQPLA